MVDTGYWITKPQCAQSETLNCCWLDCDKYKSLHAFHIILLLNITVVALWKLLKIQVVVQYFLSKSHQANAFKKYSPAPDPLWTNSSIL